MFQNSLHSLAGRVTNVASNVTSTVKELATEVMDNEREYKREREEVKASAARGTVPESAPQRRGAAAPSSRCTGNRRAW